MSAIALISVRGLVWVGPIRRYPFAPADNDGGDGLSRGEVAESASEPIRACVSFVFFPFLLVLSHPPMLSRAYRDHDVLARSIRSGIRNRLITGMEGVEEGG